MTTNITPIEALEKILKVKLYNMPINQADGEKNYLKWYDLEHNAALEMQNIATQALAPQECDVTKCEFYDDCNGHCGCNGGHKVGVNSLTFRPMCKDNPNCYYKKWQQAEKQLHSQEKTFTVEGVHKIVNNVLGDYCEHPLTFTDFVKSYIAEFEKAVG